MTNTAMMNGSHDPQEIIKSVKKGVYAANFGGGQVDITSGKFVFSTAEAYLIENGKITTPVKGATLIGSGPDAMMRVSMIGNDMALIEGEVEASAYMAQDGTPRASLELTARDVRFLGNRTDAPAAGAGTGASAGSGGGAYNAAPQRAGCRVRLRLVQPGIRRSGAIGPDVRAGGQP